VSAVLLLEACVSADPPPCITFPSELEFPETEVGVTERRRVIARNETGELVRGVSVEPVAAPFQLELPLRSALIGEALELTATFTPIDGKAHVARTQLVGGEGCAPQVLELRGLGAGAVTLAPQLAFGPVAVGTRATRSWVATNSRRRAVLLTLQDLDRNLTFEVPSEVAIPATSTATITLRFSPLVPGPAETRLVVTSSAGDQAEVEVTAMGGIPSAELLTPRIDIDVLSSTEGTLREVRVANTGDGDLELGRSA
jgi:hypothetical protein